ncbi:hypothetical protein HMPREF9554_01481 [Treponema phagedenis F0421]|nr:hypothetical protein HMPREF9554_01481 [Treponema phagedenis F0421]
MSTINKGREAASMGTANCPPKNTALFCVRDTECPPENTDFFCVRDTECPPENTDFFCVRDWRGNFGIFQNAEICTRTHGNFPAFVPEPRKARRRCLCGFKAAAEHPNTKRNSNLFFYSDSICRIACATMRYDNE